MSVYARGYRSYEGPLRGTPPTLTIFREGFRTAFRTKAMRRLRTMTLVIFAGFAMVLYSTIGLRDLTAQFGAPMDAAAYSWDALRVALTVFYTGVMFLTALVAILVASGLVSDDLRCRALPLYLARPVRPVAYAVGKALVVPGILFWVAFVPGPLYLLLVALWQPPGGTLPFLGDHLGLVWACAKHFLVASAAYGGLTLLVSSLTARRGAAAGMAAAAIFGGTMLQGLGSQVRGPAGEALRVLGLPLDTLVWIVEATSSEDRWFRRAERGFPETSHALALALLLLAAGLFAAWRRARSVEVSG